MTGPKYSSLPHPHPSAPQEPHGQVHEFRPASLHGAEASRQTALLTTTVDGVIYLFWNARNCLHVKPLQVSRREEGKKGTKSIRGWDRTHNSCMHIDRTNSSQTQTLITHDSLFYQLDAQILYFNTFIIFSTCFEHYYAYLQEENCISTASRIVSLFG